MADLVITASDVQPGANGIAATATAGEAIDAGEVIYLDTSDNNKAKLADANDSAKIAVVGIAVASAAQGQPVPYAGPGSITLSAVMTAGTLYFLSQNAPGKLAPEADLLTADYKVLVGGASSTSAFEMHLWNSGLQVP